MTVEEHEEWLKRYKRKLIYAWKMGFDNDEAAKRLGIDESEVETHLAFDEELRVIRKRNLDELAGIAYGNVADAIRDENNKDHLKASEWYLEKRDPRFGAKGIKTDFDIEDSIEEKKQEMEDFMEGFKARPNQFDGR